MSYEIGKSDKRNLVQYERLQVDRTSLVTQVQNWMANNVALRQNSNVPEQAEVDAERTAFVDAIKAALGI